MNTNCLVTKLKGVVEDDSLMRFGYFKLSLVKSGSNDIQVSVRPKIGENKFYTSAPCVINNVTYPAGEVVINSPNGTNDFALNFSTSVEIEIPKTIKRLCLYFAYITDAKAFSYLSEINDAFVCNFTGIIGLKNLRIKPTMFSITDSSVNKDAVSYDASELDLSNISSLTIYGGNIEFPEDGLTFQKDISVSLSFIKSSFDIGKLYFAQGKKVGQVLLAESSGLFGSAEVLINRIAATGTTQSNARMSLLGSPKITGGDVSNCHAAQLYGTNRAGFTCSWGTRTQPYILGMNYIPLGNDVDKMLIQQAALPVNPAITDSGMKSIQVSGTRTSASDAAISTLLCKGYTVTITAG